MTKNQNKTIENDNSVEAFLNSVPNEERKADCFRIKEMMEEISGHSPKMWGNSIVGFDSYHYKYETGREGDMLKVGFSPRAQNLSIYIMPGFKRYDTLMEKLGKHKTGKSCLYVKRLSDIDEQVLKTLIKESYDHMTKKYG